MIMFLFAVVTVVDFDVDILQRAETASDIALLLA